jgi:nucleotide-binding universal stress UspA family protein
MPSDHPADRRVTDVVVGFDGSPESDDALAWALREARSRDVAVRVIHVWNPGGSPQEVERLAARQSVAELRDDLHRDLSAAVGAVIERVDAPDVTVTAQVLHGHVVRTLITEAGAGSLLVVGSRGRGNITGSMLGSVSQSAVQYAAGPVVVVRGDRPGTGPRRVVVGVDGSPSSVRALRFADEAARRLGATLRVVHAWTLPYLGFAGRTGALTPSDHDEVAARAGEVLRQSVTSAEVDLDRPGVEMLLAEGSPILSLLEAASGADLLVLGSRGYGGWKGLLLGSVSSQSVTRAPCPVVVVRASSG